MATAAAVVLLWAVQVAPSLCLWTGNWTCSSSMFGLHFLATNDMASLLTTCLLVHVPSHLLLPDMPAVVPCLLHRPLTT
jgi:hypothetical protein